MNPNAKIPPALPIKLIIAFALLLNGFGVTSGIKDTAGVLNTLIATKARHNTTKKPIKNPKLLFLTSITYGVLASTANSFVSYNLLLKRYNLSPFAYKTSI